MTLQYNASNFDYAVITEDGRRIKTHKNLLAKKCGYFNRLFLSNSVASNENIHSLPCSESTLRTLLEYMYCGETIIDLSSPQKIIECAIYLEMPSIISDIIKGLINNITLNNCLHLFFYSTTILFQTYTIGGLELRNACAKYIVEHIDEIGMIYLCTIEEMEFLLSFKESNFIRNEEKVCFAMLQWFLFDIENRKNLLHRLMCLINLESLSPEFAREHLLNNIHNNYIRQYTQIMMEIGRQNVPEEMVIEYLEINNSIESQFELYGAYDSGIYLFTYNSIIDPVPCKMIDIPKSIQKFDCATFGRSNIFICGGRVGNRSVKDCYTYSIDDLMWKALPPMRHARVCHRVVEFNNSMYVCGGYTGSSVEIWDIKSGVWNDGPKLKKLKRDYALCADKQYGGCIYAVNHKNIEVLDPRQGFWNLLEYYNPHEVNSAFVHKNIIYSVSSKSINAFDIRSRSLYSMSIFGKNYSFACKSISSCIIDENVYLAGFTETGNFMLKSYNNFDFSTCTNTIYSLLNQENHVSLFKL